MFIHSVLAANLYNFCYICKNILIKYNENRKKT